MSLSAGIGLMFALIPFYLSGVAYAVSTGLREHEPIGVFAFGIISLLSIGFSLFLGIRNRRPSFFWALLPLASCFVFVFASGLFHGQVRDPSEIQNIASAVEIGILGFAFWKLRPHWFTASAFSALSATMWLFTLFVSSMAFTDTWL